MAPSNGSVHPARSLALFGAILVALYALVFFTGDKSPTPKLGIDLQGGTRVTLTARTPDGSSPSQDSLRQAQQIIETRVNGLGVSGSEVVVDGDNLVITVPGDDSAQAKTLGQTARLYIRPVIGGPIASANTAAQNPEAQTPETQTPAEPAPENQAPENPAPENPEPQGRPFPAQEPTDTPVAPENAAQPETTTPESPATPAPEAPAPGELDPQEQAAADIAAAKALRQSEDPAIQQQAAM